MYQEWFCGSFNLSFLDFLVNCVGIASFISISTTLTLLVPSFFLHCFGIRWCCRLIFLHSAVFGATQQSNTVLNGF